MSVLRMLAIVRTIQRICNVCARVQLVWAHPFEAVVCKYCGSIIPARDEHTVCQSVVATDRE
jgi:hypothetical protein